MKIELQWDSVDSGSLMDMDIGCLLIFHLHTIIQSVSAILSNNKLLYGYSLSLSRN